MGHQRRTGQIYSTKSIFAQYTAGDDFGFNKTVVPVRLAQYGDYKLVSRSQAKRLLARVDRFKVVILDFDGVESIGQAFADEVFRVFVNKNPQVELIATEQTEAVQQMILRAQAGSMTSTGSEQQAPQPGGEI
jgi:hypothetical protein